MSRRLWRRPLPPHIVLKSNNIYLVGPMGSGKTTIGRRVARVTGRAFQDSDREIEERTGVSIAVIFEVEGEAGFRLRERQVIDDLTQLQDTVVATGGGAVIDPQNRRCLRERGFVVYLRSSVDRLYAHTWRSRNRPLLRTADPKARLAELLAERDPWYREVANLIVDTDGRTAHQLVHEITTASRSRTEVE
ncbi:MAG: shikimate kinase [Gammaproteobacteria bacterium]